MKKANGIKLLTLAGLMATAACTGDFLNKNTNPDQATDEMLIIGKTKCDGIQNQMRLFGGRVSPKRKATKISHTHTKKHRSNGF